MALTHITPTKPETVTGMEVCTCCAFLISAGAATDQYGGYWEINPSPTAYAVNHCDLCRNPIGADRVSASVAFLCVD